MELIDIIGIIASKSTSKRHLLNVKHIYAYIIRSLVSPES